MNIQERNRRFERFAITTLIVTTVVYLSAACYGLARIVQFYL